MTSNMIQQKYINFPAASAELVEDQHIYDLQLLQASKLHKAGKLAEARLIYEEVFKLNPEKFEILHLFGTLEAQSRNFDRAVDLLGQAVLKELPLWDTFFNLANALMEVKDYENSIKNYKESLKIKYDNSIVLNNLGLALHQIKAFEEALENYNKALLIEVNNEKLYFNKGNTLNELRLFDEAIECYKNAAIINPNNAYYYYNLGLVQCELKKYKGWDFN
jgi:tetratricopeptide (TPR) repeat protein